jgi:hypothetical protein
VNDAVDARQQRPQAHHGILDGKVQGTMGFFALETLELSDERLSVLKSIEQFLPVKADQLLGQTIDVFHKHPEHQRKLLADPKNLPHKAVIQVGPEKLDLVVSAILDNNGNYVGPMLTWDVITEKLATEERTREMQERERQSAEELPTKGDAILEVVSAAASGDLTREIAISGSDAIGRMADGMRRFLSARSAPSSTRSTTSRTRSRAPSRSRTPRPAPATRKRPPVSSRAWPSSCGGWCPSSDTSIGYQASRSPGTKPPPPQSHDAAGAR